MSAESNSTIRLCDASARRHHHGWQRPLGVGARAAARGGASARGGGVAQDRSRRRRNRHFAFSPSFRFSAENWSRPPSEIRDLMGLLRRFIRNDLAELHQNGVKVRVIGERGDLDPDIRRLLEEAEELTTNNTGLTLVVAFNYGARQEIARAAARIAAMIKDGALDPAGDHRRPHRPEPRRAGPARPRSHYPHQRRAAVVQLPAVAGRLQRTGVRTDLLA